MEITKEVAAKVLSVVDVGLCSGKGKPIPGQMCVEAAVTFALGEDFSDNPSCVAPALRSFKIRLNDSRWSSNEARAKGLRRIAIAQLGTKDTLDEKEFVKQLAEPTIKKILPIVLRRAADKLQEPHKSNLRVAASKCEVEGTLESAREARTIARAAADAAYVADAAAADAAAYAAYAAYAADAADAAYVADAAAAADAAYAAYAADARDKLLSNFAEDVVQILIKMETPGSKFLDELCPLA